MAGVRARYISSKGTSKRSASATLHLTEGLLQWLYLILSTLRAAVRQRAQKLWYGDEVEEPKVIQHKASVLRAIRKCAIHFAPISATTALAGLNLGGYFIGDEYSGLNSGLWQDVDKLALQIAAKLYVGTPDSLTLRGTKLNSSSGIVDCCLTCNYYHGHREARTSLEPGRLASRHAGDQNAFCGNQFSRFPRFSNGHQWV